MANGHTTNEDCRAVIEAAETLSLREIDLFRLAYRRWFGHDAAERDIERIFADYMFNERVPSWLRHFCRQVRILQETGRLDPQALGAGNFRKRDTVPRVGRLFLAIAGILMLIVYLSILNTYPAVDADPCNRFGLGGYFEHWIKTIQGEPSPCRDSPRTRP